MATVAVPLHKPLDIRGTLHKAFQLVEGTRAIVFITLDPDVLAHMTRSLEERERGDVTWAPIATLTPDAPYATHTGVGTAVLVEADPGTVVVMGGHT